MRGLTLISGLLLAALAWGDDVSQVNKLQQMYRLYYLPYTIEFQQGRTVNDIFPMVKDGKEEFTKLLKPEELRTLDSRYSELRTQWKKKSLFLQTPVELGKTLSITQKLVSHRLPLSRTGLDDLSLDEKIQYNALTEGKSPEVKKSVLQMRYLRSLIQPLQADKLNFFVIGPSWCESTKEYRSLIEEYAKRFPKSDLVIHSVIIEDPKEEIFDSRLLSELFPHPEKYTHDNVPRFLAMQSQDGVTQVWEEGEALKLVLDHFFAEHRGFIDAPAPVRSLASVPLKVDPVLSSTTK